MKDQNRYFRPFIKLNRHSPKLIDLIRKRPSAFSLLTLMAMRTRRTSEINDGLEVGEALIGDYKEYKATPQIYRRDKQYLEQIGEATFKPTNKGTVAKLISNEIFDVNLEDPTSTSTSDQQPDNKQTTTNNKDKKENNDNNAQEELDYFFLGNKKIIGGSKLIELKQQNPIVEVAERLGLNPVLTGVTTAVKCFNPSHKDDKPSLVLKPRVNKFECMACRVKGDVFDLIKGFKGLDFKGAVTYLDPNFYKNLPKKSAAKDYLEERGIKKETQEKFGLKDRGNTLAIPISEGFNVYRHFDGNRKFSCTKGRSPVIYKAGYTFEDEICLTEGIMDAIKLWQETGYPCWTLSHGGALTFKDSFIEEFKGIERVYIVYDNDEEGQKGALIVQKKVGKDICRIGQLPNGIKDITEYFQKGFSNNDFETLLANSV